MLLHKESFGSFWRILVLAIVLGLSIFGVTSLYAQSEEVEKINEKAEKYFTLLSESPSGDYLYDRFYDAWLDTGTVEGLEQFLKENISKSSEYSGHLLLAFFYERQGKDKEALEHFNEASIKEPKPDILYQKALVEARLSQLDSAISDLLEANKSNDDKELSIKISKLLAKLYIRSGEKDSAADVWQKLISSNPDDEEIYEDMIELQVSEGLYGQAIDTSDQLLKITKDSYKTIMRQLRKADIYQYGGKNEQALDIYSKTLSLVGQGTWLENQICSQVERVFRKQDEIRSLQGYWEKIIEDEPQRISIKKRLAQLLLQFNEIEKALNLYQEIVRVTPGDKINQQAYIQALRSVSQTSKAIDLMEQLCKQNPDDRELLIELADLYYLNRDKDSVVKTLEKFLDGSEKSEYVFMRVARILENYNYKEEVLGVFEKLTSNYPDSLTAKEAYAEILYKYDKKDEAIEFWENLAASGDFQTLLRVSKTVSARGYSESALKWLEARYNEFENDIAYINQLCEVAIRLKLYDRCEPWLEKQLMMADRSSLIQAAIKQKLQVEKYSGKINQEIEKLKAREFLSVQETCLLSELLEYNRLSKDAQDVIDDFLVDVNDFDIDEAARKTQKEIAIHQKIHLYSISKQWEQAAECTKKLIAMKGTQDSAYVLELINLYERAGKWELALEWIPAWRRASPGSVEPVLAESRILRRLYKIDTAIERLRAAEQAFENNKDILSELASLYRTYNRPSEAYRITWRLYDEAEDPTTKLGYVRDLAVIAKSMGNMENLIGKLQEQKSNNRTSVVPLLALAEVYRQAEKYEERLQVLMEATRLRPNDITLLSEIARMEESEGFWEQAIDTLQQALPLDATNSTKQKLARLYIQYGNEEEGYRLLFDLDGKASTDPLEVMTTLQAILAETNWDIAEKYLAEVLPAFPDDYRLHYLYGLCLSENGKYQESLEEYIRIIGMKAELPGVTSQGNVPQQSSYIEQIAKIAPPGVAEILSVQQIFSRALSYNRQNNNLPYWYYPNNSRSSITINIPQRVEEAPGFAIAQIFYILNNDSMFDVSAIDSELRESTLKNVMQENNFSGLEFIFEDKNFNIENIASTINEIAPKHPDNEAIQGFWAIYYSSNLNSDEKHLRHVFEMFKNTYPSLSCMLGLMYGSVNENGSDLFEQSLELLSKIDGPEEYLMSRIIQIIRSQSQLVKQEQKTILADKLMDWYENINSDPSQNPNRNEISYSLLSALFYTGEKDALIRILNQEVENYKNNYNLTQSNTSLSQTDIRIQNLRYPPTYNFPDFPSSISSIAYQFARESISISNSGYSLSEIQGIRQNSFIQNKLFEPNNIDDFVSQLEEPLLKAVMYIAANQDDKAMEILENKLKAEPNSISATVISASILANQNKLEQAILLLSKVQSYAPDVATQQMVDGAIVSYSRNINFAQNQEALNAAREAAMRLTKGQFTQSGYRDILVEIMMNYLGLKDEATLFAQQSTSTMSNPSVYSTQVMQQQLIQQQLVQQGSVTQIRIDSRTARTQGLTSIQYNKIVELLRDDKKDAGIRLLISDLKTIASESLLPERYYNINNSNIRNRITLVHSNNLEDQILELANPAPSKNVRQMLIYARLCDLIDRKDEAKQAYEMILESRPKEFGALLWLALEYADTEPDKATKYLLAVDHRYQSQLGRQISSYIQNNFNYQEDFEGIFKYTSMAALYLDNLKDSNSIDLSWAANIPNTLARSYSRNNIRLPQLYSQSQTNVITDPLGRVNAATNLNTLNQEIAEKRRQVHNEFCKTMLRIPQLAAQGFACLHSEARARNAVDDSIEAMALEALLKYNSSRNYANGGLMNTYSWGTGKDFRLISPMEFLLYHNFKNGTLDEFVEKVTPILENNNRIGEMKQLKLYASLYQAPPEKFVSQAKALIESDIISENPSPYNVVNKQTALSQIIEIRTDRSLKENLNQFLIGMIDINNLNSVYQVQDVIRIYLTQLAKEDVESANEFVEDVVTVFLGPKEKRREFITQNYNQSRNSTRSQFSAITNMNNDRIQLCLNLLRNLAQNGELIFTILSQFEDFESNIPDIRYYVQNGIDNVIQKALNSSSQTPVNQDDFKGLLSMLNYSPFLRDVNSFRTLPVTQLQKSSAYTYMLSRILRSQNTQYKNLRTNLSQALSDSLSQKKGDEGFGTELLIAQLSDNKRQDVFSCLDKYWESFQKLDTARQQEISIMVCETVGLIVPTDNSISEDVETIIAQLNKLLRDASQEKVAAFLKNKQFEDFNFNDSQFIEYSSNLIGSLASYDVDASVEVLTKAVKIIDDAISRGKFQRSYTSEQMISNVLSRMREDRNNISMSSLGFVIKLFRDANELSQYLEPSYISQFDNSLYYRFRELNPTNTNSLEVLKNLYNELGPCVGKGNLSGISIFRRLFDNTSWNETLITEVIDWANEQIESNNYPDLARALSAEASLYKQGRYMNRNSWNANNATVSSDNLISEIEQYYMNSLTDSNLPVLWRLMANYSITQNNSNIVSDQLLKQAIEITIEGWKKYPNLNAQYCTNTINIFIDVLVPERNQQSNRTQISSSSTSVTRAEWTDAAARIADVYMAFRQPAQTTPSISPVRSSSRSSGYESNPTIQLSMLEINLVLGRDDAAMAMLDGFDSQAGTYIDCWALLVKYNKPNLLKYVVDKQWSNSINQAGRIRFDKDIEKNLSSCIDDIKSEDLKFLAQVLISSLQDEGNNTQRPTVRRNERLEKLAGEIGGITFNSTQVKQRILEIYINETQLIPLVTEHLAEEGKKINLSALIASQDSNLIRTQSQLIVAYCMSSLLDGDPNVFIQTIRACEVYMNPSQNPPQGARQVIENIGRQLANISETIRTDWTKSQVSSLATGVSEYLASSSARYFNTGRLMSDLVTFHVIANRENEIPAALEKINYEIRQNLQNYLNLSEMSNSLARFTRQRNLTLEERIDIIKRFYQTDPVQDAMERDSRTDMVSYLTNYNLLSRQEIDQNRDLLKDLFIQTKRIQAFLKASNVIELASVVNESQLRQYVTVLLNSTMWQDSDLCTKILLQAKFLYVRAGWSSENTGIVQPDLNSGNEQRISGNEFISNILLQRRNSSSFSYADIGIIVGLIRDSNGPQVVLDQDYLQRINSSISTDFRQSLQQEYNNNLLEALKAFYSKIGPYFGKGNASGYSIFLANILQNTRGNPDIEQIQKWAKEQVQKGEYPSLAQEISFIVSRLNLSTQRGRRVLISIPDPEIDEPMRKYYLEVLADSKLSVIWRLMALEEYRKQVRFDTNLNDENVDIIFKAISLVIEGFGLYPDLHETYYTDIISAFAKLKDKPNWKELAEKLSQAYEQFKSGGIEIPAESHPAGAITLLQQNGRPVITAASSSGGNGLTITPVTSNYPSNMPPELYDLLMSREMRGTRPIVGSSDDFGMVESSPTNPVQNEIDKTELSMLEIRLALNQDELIEKQLNSSESFLGQSLDVWIILAQHGKDAMLKDVIEKNWQNVSLRSNLLFTKDLEISISRCMQQISRDDIRYFAEVVLSSLFDSRVNDEVPVVSHRDRMIRLAEMYQKVDFSDYVLKQRILSLMINVPEALKYLGDSLGEQVAKINLNSLFSSFDNAASDQFNLVLAYSCEKLLKGDPNDFIKLVKSIPLNTSRSRGNPRTDFLRIIDENFNKTVDSTKSNWSVSQMAAFAAASTELLSQDSIPLNNSTDFITNHYIYFVLGQKTDELQNSYRRFASWASQTRQNTERYERLRDYYTQLSSYMVNANLSFEQRLDIINRFNSPDWIANMFNNTGRRLQNFNIVQILVDSKIFTRQETIDNASSFAEMAYPAISNFLNIKNAADLNLDSYRLDSYVYNLVSSITIYDTDLVLKIINKANDLYQEMLKSGTVREAPYESNFITRAISRLIQRDSNRIEGLKIIIKLVRDTKDTTIIPDNNLFQMDRQIVSYIMQSTQNQKDLLEVIKNFYKQIGPCVGKDNASGISGIISTMFSNLQIRDNKLWEAIIQWSNEQAQSGDYPLLAREIEMMAIVYSNRPAFGITIDSEKVKPVVEYYRNVINDENLTLPWRLMTVHAMENWINYSAYDELVDQAVNVLASCSNKYSVFSWDLHSNLLNRFIRSSHQEASGMMRPNNAEYDFSPLRSDWVNIASNALDSYIKYSDKRSVMSRSISNVQGGFRQSSSISELVMLEVSLLLKDNQAAKKLLWDSEGTLKTSSCSLSLLIQYQNNSLLQEFIKENIENVKLDSRGIYNSQLEDRITESLKNILRQDEQYLVKLFLYAHNNRYQGSSYSPFGGRGNYSTRQDRLKMLAEQFNEIEYESDILKKNALTYLVQEASVLPYISKAVNEQAKKIELELMSFRSSSNVYILDNPDFQICLADRMRMLMDGDADGFTSLLNDSKLIYDPNHDLDYTISTTMVSAYIRVITETDWDAKSLPAFLSASDKLLVALLNGRGLSSIITQLMSCKTVLLLLAEDSSTISQNTMQEIESTFDMLKIYQEMLRGSRSNTLSIRNNDIIAAHQVMSRYMNSSDMAFEKRMEVLKKFYSIKRFSDAMNQSSNNSMLALISNERILSMDEIFEHADTLMSLHVASQADWQLLAIFQSREGLLDDAEKTWQKAVEIGIKTDTTWTSMRDYMNFLNSNNLRDKALEYWSSFDKKSLSPKALAEYNNLIQSLSNQI